MWQQNQVGTNQLRRHHEARPFPNVHLLSLAVYETEYRLHPAPRDPRGIRCDGPRRRHQDRRSLAPSQRQLARRQDRDRARRPATQKQPSDLHHPRHLRRQGERDDAARRARQRPQHADRHRTQHTEGDHGPPSGRGLLRAPPQRQAAGRQLYGLRAPAPLDDQARGADLLPR